MFDQTNIGGWKIYCVNLLTKCHLDYNNTSVLPNIGAKIQGHKVSVAVADPGFSPGGALTPKSAIIVQLFAENCMKMKEFGPPGRARVPGAPPWIRQ